MAPDVADDVRALIREAQHAVVNLEAPLTQTTHRIKKSGPAIVSHPASAAHLKDVGFAVVTTANNHILDAGRIGLRDTLAGCRRAGLAQAGIRVEAEGEAGSGHLDLPLLDGSTVRILSYCEHEWSVTDGDSAVGWSVVAAARGVIEAKVEGKRVVVVLHGGNEYFPLPRPVLRDELRFLAEVGADAVIMHHNHMPSAYEVWAGVPIAYGIGNFQFAMANPHSEWHEGLLAGITFEESGARLSLTPVVTSESFEVSLACGADKERILNQVEGYKQQVTSDVALRALWDEFCSGTGKALLRVALQPTSSRGSALIVEAWISHMARHPENLLVLTNVMQCESLRDLITDHLRNAVDDTVDWG
ncbi:CapA family protein [Ornithinimicrobium cerasi]|uniref:CapA family protein n=1 Tax=Ornithinimicrobium cerasi TaxID=2248773 RepID=UPI002351BC20|nr:CapA family protein [Ornithinimicrobium cerasi]